MAKKNRYIFVIDFFVYAENKEEAIKEAQKICDEINDKYDYRASILKDEFHLANSAFPEKIKLK
jgi:hypothetical protein